MLLLRFTLRHPVVELSRIYPVSVFEPDSHREAVVKVGDTMHCGDLECFREIRRLDVALELQRDRLITKAYLILK